MPRGRPVKSAIRQRIVEILAVMGKGYGYQIYQVYEKIYPRATMRSIYYNLTKGSNMGEFAIERVQMEKGNYSWGSEAEKTYYKLGPQAHPLGDDRVRKVLEQT